MSEAHLIVADENSVCVQLRMPQGGSPAGAGLCIADAVQAACAPSHDGDPTAFVASLLHEDAGWYLTTYEPKWVSWLYEVVFEDRAAFPSVRVGNGTGKKPPRHPDCVMPLVWREYVELVNRYTKKATARRSKELGVTLNPRILPVPSEAFA